MTKPAAKAVKVIAATAGLVVTDEVAERIAHAIGPAFDAFAGVAGTLPMDLEPATYLTVQQTKAKA